MRTLTGAILLVGAEQAFAHAHMAAYPHAGFVREILLPSSIALLVLGLLFLVWGIWTERRSPASRGEAKSDG